MNLARQKALDYISQIGGLIRTRDALKIGIHRRTLYGLWEEGSLIQLSRGLFQLADLNRPPGAHLAEISKKAPSAIICLKSALALHELSDQEPDAVWLAVERKTRKPVFEHPPVKPFFFSGEMFYRGVQTLTVMNQAVRVYNAPKTVIDCFRWHKKVGLDSAIQAARVYLARRDASPSELMRYAKICKIESRFHPYLQVLLS
ncbi:MAG: type IV toxin-antitoxin system AbiEi family antitoxin domain-containing protein [Deltaproteobacteria bacterium]|jgi:predicted transcriptional regulator of viral defense system|nr:type IV toxin-antitoxin system AbiEi family antitoxin domain-containing protein [Deltaproteobacteria bacterium]